MSGKKTEINDRAMHLLKVLIEGYIADGTPVGSTTLAKRSGLQLSSATIRNVMSKLEDHGYIHAPHTSAGRIPTAQGYRVFVDSLVNVKPLEDQDLSALEVPLGKARTQSELIQTASGLLSSLTQLAGVVTIPKVEALEIRHIEFLHLSSHQVLVVLVMSDSEVQNRIINTEREHNSSELQQASNYLNEHLGGRDLESARSHLLASMKQDQEALNRMMKSAIELGEKAFEGFSDKEPDDEDCLIVGKTKLMAYDDLSDIEKLRQIFGAFNEKREVLGLLDNCINASGVQIFIGRESGRAVFDDCSLVTAQYTIDDKYLGVLGVIGPQRMRYERVIPVVDITARLLSAALGSKTL